MSIAEFWLDNGIDGEGFTESDYLAAYCDDLEPDDSGDEGRAGRLDLWAANPDTSSAAASTQALPGRLPGTLSSRERRGRSRSRSPKPVPARGDGGARRVDAPPAARRDSRSAEDGRKCYAVRVGRSPGIYYSEAAARAKVTGVPLAEWRKFPSTAAAEDFLASDGGPRAAEGYGSGASEARRPRRRSRPYSAEMHELGLHPHPAGARRR